MKYVVYFSGAVEVYGENEAEAYLMAEALLKPISVGIDLDFSEIEEVE